MDEHFVPNSHTQKQSPFSFILSGLSKFRLRSRHLKREEEVCDTQASFQLTSNTCIFACFSVCVANKKRNTRLLN